MRIYILCMFNTIYIFIYLQPRKFKEVILFGDLLKMVLYKCINLAQKPPISHSTSKVAV